MFHTMGTLLIAPRAHNIKLSSEMEDDILIFISLFKQICKRYLEIIFSRSFIVLKQQIPWN